MAEPVRHGIAIVAEMLIQELENMKKKKRRPRKVWVRDWIRRRDELGASSCFLSEVSIEDPTSFKNHLRLTCSQFESLLGDIEPHITKLDTNMRQALPARIKLQIALRYLATGESFSSLEHMYRVPKCTISKFMVDVLKAIYEERKHFVKIPTCEEDWKTISKGFNNSWNFPGCCGAIDGKHINIQCPPKSGSDFYNYKGYFSTVLFAVVDSDYCFMYLNIGSNGRANDSTIFSNSDLKYSIENGSINFPKWGVIVGDDAFPLKDYLMKPYSRHRALTPNEKIFNYRLSRARMVVENAFGILAMRFRIFRSAIALNPDKVDHIVKAACSLHNWLRITSPSRYTPSGSVDQEDDQGNLVLGSWRSHGDNSGLQNLHHTLGSNNFSRAAEMRRKKYVQHFVSDGSVPWQWSKIN